MSVIKLTYTVPKCRMGLDLKWPCDTDDCCPEYRDNYFDIYSERQVFCDKCIHLAEGKKHYIEGFYKISYTLDGEDPAEGKILFKGKTIPQEWVDELIRDDTVIIKEGEIVI